MEGTLAAPDPPGVQTPPQRPGALPALRTAPGDAPDDRRVREAGEGNPKLVFIAESDRGFVIVRQALPDVRLAGDSWPLPLKRAFFDCHAPTRQAARDPGRVPEVLYSDEAQALIVMERLSPHIILRGQMMAGGTVADLGATLGRFCARTAFRGPDPAMPAADKKADVALFAGNVDLCDITGNLVFTDPYFDAPMNRHTAPQLDPLVAELRADGALKIAAQHSQRAFSAKAETLCHGDLHAGSVMVTADEAPAIDPEFAFYGPFGFDIGMMPGHFLMAVHASPAHLPQPDRCRACPDWLLAQAGEMWAAFTTEFAALWRAERRHPLPRHALRGSGPRRRRRGGAGAAAGRDPGRHAGLCRGGDAPPHPGPGPHRGVRQHRGRRHPRAAGGALAAAGGALVLNRHRLAGIERVL